MPLYAAYASNLDPARMAELCPHSPLEGVGWVEGWRLTFGGEEHGWDGAQATLVEAPDSQVFVAIYDVPPEDEAVLATWEGSTSASTASSTYACRPWKARWSPGSTSSTPTRVGCRRPTT
ncbi:MAG: hypothetical protein WKF83_13630 [Nocardioidaceae bacterium]